jgi:transposase
MLEMDLVHRIRQRVLVEGLSSRRAALDLDVSRNTVKKYTHPSEPLPEPPRGDPRFAKIRAWLGELILEWQPPMCE